MALSKRSGTILWTADIAFSRYYQLGAWRCSSSPSGAHHWLIDGGGMGQCKYCGERRQFVESEVLTNGGTADIRWGQSQFPEEWLRELLIVARS